MIVWLLLAAALVSAGRRRRRERRPTRRRARCGSTSSTPAAPARSTWQKTAWCAKALGPATRRAIDDTNLGGYLFEVREPSHATASSTHAASPASTANGRRPTRRSAPARAFHESLRFPGAARARCRWPSASAARTACSAQLWTAGRRPGRPAIDRSEAQGARLGRDRERRSRRQGRPRAARRRLHRGRDGEVASRRAAPGGVCSSRSRPSRSAGATSTSGRSTRRPLRAASHGPRTASTGARRCGAAYDAFGSERYVLAFDDKRMREAAAAAPYDALVIVVNEPQVRGRRGLQPLFDRRRGQRLHALPPRPRVRPPLRGPGRRVLHLRSGLRRGGRAARALGAERDSARGGAPKWRDLLTAGHAAADALEQGGLRDRAAGDPGAAAADPGREAARGGDGGPLPRGAAADGAAAATRVRRRRPSGPSRGRCTRRRATSEPRPTASCSRAASASAPSAAGPSSA